MSRQDPHRIRDRNERNLERAIGRAVRDLRQRRGQTVVEAAQAAGLSAGMLSKIENGATSPSLATLQALADALDVPVTSLFRHFEAPRPAVHTRAGAAVGTTGAGTRAGHHYDLLGHLGAHSAGVTVEPYLITLTTDSDTFPTFQHEGLEVLYMLEGAVDYRHGDQLYPLRPGDSLFFDADAPHGPEVLVDLPARYLSIITYRQDSEISPQE